MQRQFERKNAFGTHFGSHENRTNRIRRLTRLHAFYYKKAVHFWELHLKKLTKTSTKSEALAAIPAGTPLAPRAPPEEENEKETR